MKTLKITEELHQLLKIESAKKGITVFQLLVEILTKHFALVCLVALVGC